MGAEQTSPELLRIVYDGTRLLIMLVDKTGMVVWANRALEDALGRRQADCLVPVWDLAALPDERAALRAAFEQRGSGLPPNVMFHVVGDGLRVVDWTTKAVSTTSRGAIVVFTGVDLTERLQAEAAMRRNDVQNRLLDRIPAILWTTDRGMRFTSSVGHGLSRLGLQAREVSQLGTSLYSFFHTEDPDHPVIAAHRRALSGERATYDATWHDRVFQSTVEPLLAEDGAVIGCVGIALDITERVQAERALRESERRLRRLVDANIIGIFTWEPSGRIHEANRAMLDVIGYSRDDVQSGGLSWVDLTPPEYRARDREALDEIDATGRCKPYEKEYFDRSGNRVPVVVGGTSFHEGPSGGVEQGIAFVLDVREQVRLRAQHGDLLARERQARQETEDANVRLVLLAEAGKALSRALRARETFEILLRVVIPALADWSLIVLGADDASATGAHGDPSSAETVRRLAEILRPDPHALEGVARVFRTGEAVAYAELSEAEIAPSSGECSILGTRQPEAIEHVRELGMRSLLCVPIAGRRRVDAVLVLAAATNPRRYEPTDVLLAEELAGRASASLENGRLLDEALEAVRAREEFLSIAAHELRTPLTSLGLHVQMLERMANEPSLDAPALRGSIGTVKQQTRHVTRLVDSLLEVSRIATGRLSISAEPIDLAEVVREVVASMALDLDKAGCAVALDAPASLVGRWDRTRMQQLVTNLLANASRFGKGRPIEVRAGSEGDLVTVSVRDHGIGIAREDQARIFGRFERAVSPRHFGGLGLGLYVSAQVARAHGGTLSVESEPGEGATFTLRLPRSA